MLVGPPDTKQEIIFNAIREHLLAMPDTDVRKIDPTEENTESQMRTIFQELENRYHTMAELEIVKQLCYIILCNADNMVRVFVF